MAQNGTLTLRDGELAATFRPFRVSDAWRLIQEEDAGIARLRARYPALLGLSDEDYQKHPDAFPYTLDHPWHTIVYPALRVAWAGEGDPPTVADLEASGKREVLACARRVLHANDGDPDLDRLKQFLDKLQPAPAVVAEVADPNA